MKNKKILYGVLGLGVISGLYFFNKNKNNVDSKPSSNVGDSKPSSNVGDSKPSSNVGDSKPSPQSIPSEDVEKLSKQFADELTNKAKEEINYLTLKPIPKKPEATALPTTREEVLSNSLWIYRAFGNAKITENKINYLNRLKNSYGNIYLMFKKGASNFTNIQDYKIACNILIKKFVFGDEGVQNGRATITNEEQIWVANNQNLGEGFGFDTTLIFPKKNIKMEAV